LGALPPMLRGDAVRQAGGLTEETRRAHRRRFTSFGTAPPWDRLPGRVI